MPLEKITERILEDAQEAAAKILEDGKEEAEKIDARFEERARHYEERALKDAQQQARAKESQLINAARRMARNEILARKQEWIQRVFDEVKEDILKMPETEYLSFLVSLAQKAQLRGEETIGLSQRDLAILEKLRDRLSREFPGNRFKLMESPFPIEAGLVIKRGQTFLNASVDAVLDELREREGREVARILFPEDGDGV